MSEDERKKLVYMEWNSDDKRHDFKIYMVNKGDKVTSDTKCIIIECKRDDFNEAARLQSIGYVVTTKNVFKIIGVSRGIKTKNVNSWNKLITNIKGSGQLSFVLEDSLIDVDYNNNTTADNDKFVQAVNVEIAKVRNPKLSIGGKPRSKTNKHQKKQIRTTRKMKRRLSAKSSGKKKK
jgi:hypothetical protein